MAAPINFVSQTQINAKKELKRKARQDILKQAKEEYEREERRREKRKESGEGTWMLPSVSKRIANDDGRDDKEKSSKKKKHKKEKKNKKHKKKNKREKKETSDDLENSESDSEDEWVVKGAEMAEADVEASSSPKSAPVQRDGWMLLPTFSLSPTRKLQQDEKQEEQMEVEEEEKKLSYIDVPGRHANELNPYWKDGGTGLPSEREHAEMSGTEIATSATDFSSSYDIRFLKKAYQRSKEQAEEEGRTLKDVVAERWGSLERLEGLMSAAEKKSVKEEQRSSSTRWKNERGRDRYGDRDRNKGRDRHNYDRDKEMNNGRNENRARNRDTDGDRNTDRERERNTDRERERNTDRERERNKGRDDCDRRRKGKRQDLDKDRDIRDDKDRKETEEQGERWQHRHNDDKGTSDRPRKNVFLRPSDTSDRAPSSFSGKFMRPTSSTSTASSSRSTWDFSSTAEERETSVPAKPSRASGGWRKKTATEDAVEKQKEKAKREDRREESSDSSGSKDGNSSEEDTEAKPDKSVEVSQTEMQTKQPVPSKRVTEADLNNMGAKILRAELMGNEEMATKLKSELEQMREDKAAQDSAAEPGETAREQEVIVLTRTDKTGNTRPVELSATPEPKGGRRKKTKASTHDQSGERERYFADDDRFSLKEMVRSERMNTAEDYDAMFSRLSSKGASKTDSDDFTIDDHFVTAAATKMTRAQAEEREKRKAIAEHKRLSEQLSKCRFCFENPDMSKHLIIAIGIQVYVAVPLHESLTEGHCLIVPMQHSTAATLIDEDVFGEIKVFKKGLTKMFEEMGRDVVFLETCKNLRRQNHMIIECIPIPKEDGDMAPIYFKKAILESDVEWTQNKRLIDTRQKGLRSCIPKGLPYFNVEFGLDGGFAHVIEDEDLFQNYFGKEIIGGMLDLEPNKWRRPRKENFEEHKKKVLQFADWWKPYDWTQRLERNK